MTLPDYLIHIPILLLAGVVGGFLNTVAGGASLVTFPLLVLMGLDPRIANATNNFATTTVGIQGFLDYSRRGFKNPRLTLRLAIPAFFGAIIGAYGVLALPKERFSQVVGLLMLFALVAVLYNPGKKKLEQHQQSGEPRRSVGREAFGMLIFVALGMYGGFFGGGIGMIILPFMVYYFRQDYVTGNSVKTGVVAVMNFTALTIFLYNGFVEFSYAIPLTLGMILGGYLGVHSAVKGGERFIRPFLVVVTIAASIRFLFLS